MRCIGLAKRHFLDMRFILGVMSVWLVAEVVILAELGMFTPSAKFVAFGPRADLHFMHMSIDTYYRYLILILMIVVHTFISDCIGDSLVPHVLNVLQDPKLLVLPHRPSMYIGLTTIWAMYSAVSMLFTVFIAFAQLDLLLVRLASELAANYLTVNVYLHGKCYDPLAYHRLVHPADHSAAHTSRRRRHRLTGWRRGRTPSWPSR